jgi:hypothetical protein
MKDMNGVELKVGDLVQNYNLPDHPVGVLKIEGGDWWWQNGEHRTGVPEWLGENKKFGLVKVYTA